MNLKKLMIVPMLGLSLFAVGCGADCVSVCEDANECDKDEGEEDVDCDKTCEEAEKAGCEDESDDLAGCMDDLDDVCKFDFTKDCQSELKALAKCME